MDAFETLLVDRRASGVVVLTLNRPARLNALTFEGFAEIHRFMRQVDTDDSVRAVVMTGAGRGFCSGLDLDDAATLTAMTTPQMYVGQRTWADAIASLRKTSKPVIAAVNGPASGAGLGLALAADVRLGSVDAKFNAAFVRIGLTGGDLGVSWALPRIVGLGHAAELLLTGRLIDGAEAARIGLVNRIVEGDVVEAAVCLAEEIARNSPFGVQLTKDVLQINVDAPSIEAAIALENRGQVLATRTADMAEALAAFRAKRDPEFKNR
jgi:enoyl-CoA hydratase